MGPILQQAPGKADWRPRCSETGNSARGARPAVHDRGIELDAAGCRQNASATRVEADILLENPDRRFDRVKRPFAPTKDRSASSERRLEARPSATLLLGIEPSGPHRPRPTVNHEPPSSFIHGRGHSGGASVAPVDGAQLAYYYDIKLKESGSDRR